MRVARLHQRIGLDRDHVRIGRQRVVGLGGEISSETRDRRLVGLHVGGTDGRSRTEGAGSRPQLHDVTTGRRRDANGGVGFDRDDVGVTAQSTNVGRVEGGDETVDGFGEHIGDFVAERTFLACLGCGVDVGVEGDDVLTSDGRRRSCWGNRGENRGEGPEQAGRNRDRQTPPNVLHPAKCREER